MTDHLPDCPLSAPCPVEWRRADLIDDTHPHRIVSGSSGACVECDAATCICDELRRCENRALTTARAQVIRLAPHDDRARESAYLAGVQDGYNTAVREHVAAIDRLIEAGRC